MPLAESQVTVEAVDQNLEGRLKRLQLATLGGRGVSQPRLGLEAELSQVT